MYNAGMSVISGISINNFRGLRDFQLKGARRFNLLVGPSEIGKTSVLEAINLFSVASHMGNCLETNRFRGVLIGNQQDATLAVASLFHNFQLSTITLSATTNIAFGAVNAKTEITPFMGGNEVSHKEAGMFGIQQDDLTKANVFDSLKRTVEFTGAVRGKGYHFYNLQNGGGIGPYSGNTGPYVGEKSIVRVDGDKETVLLGDNLLPLLWNTLLVLHPSLQIAVREATRHKKKGAVLEVLQKINPHIVDFVPDGEVKPPLVDIGLDKMVSSHILGDGIRRVLGMLGNLCSKDYKVHLEDEIGAGVHFGSQVPFLRAALHLARQEDKQIFATTQSNDILIALKKVLAEEEDLRDDVAVFSFMRNKHKKIAATPYLYDDIDRCIENGVEIR